MFWRWKSRGRPALPKELQELIKRMVTENPTWGAMRIRNELLLKLGLHVSAESVCKYMPKRNVDPPKNKYSSQRWSTFIHNHANGILACDFFVIVTANFRILYGFVMLEIGSHRIVHTNVTAHPTALWTLQQFREVLDLDHKYKFVLHDRDSIFSLQLDQSVSNMGVKVLKSPVRSPTANAFCERVIGSISRILKQWVKHYNQGRPHMSLGPRIPNPLNETIVEFQDHRHLLPKGSSVKSKSVLGGLHHEYFIDKAA